MKYLIILFLGFCCLPTSSANESRTVFTVWNESVDLLNDAQARKHDVQVYLQTCIDNKRSPEYESTVWQQIRNLDTSIREYRAGIEKLEEIKRRLEYPLPKGTMQAKK